MKLLIWSSSWVDPTLEQFCAVTLYSSIPITKIKDKQIIEKLEYLVLEVRLKSKNMVAPLWQLSVSSQHISCLLAAMCKRRDEIHMVKFDPESLYVGLCNLKLCTHIWSTNINFRPPLSLDILVRLGLNFHPMGEFFFWGGGSIGPADIFLSRTGRNVTT